MATTIGMDEDGTHDLGSVVARACGEAEPF